jgi:transcription-repair coupling factor (superfamily II helicase)
LPGSPNPASARDLPGRLRLDPEFRNAAMDLEERGLTTLEGVWGSAFALVVAALASLRSGGCLVVVLGHQNDIDDFCDDLRLFTGDRADVFPALDTTQSHRLLKDDNFGHRLRTLKALHSAHGPPILVTSIQALLQPCPSLESLTQSARTLAVGDRLDVEPFLKWLTANRFQHTSAVELPGEFSARGGILDLFANDWVHPIRVELFDDEIESIRQFDVASQLSLQPLDRLEITVVDNRRDHLDHFTSHLPAGSRIVFVEPNQVASEGRHFLDLLEKADEHHSLNDTFRRMQAFPRLNLTGIAQDETHSIHRLPIESVERFSGDIARVRGELDQIGQGADIRIIVETEAEKKRLIEILGDTAVVQSGHVQFILGRLKAGFRILRPPTLVISGNEMFHRAPLRRTARHQAGKAIDSFLDLREGDLVVHLAHGIGRYRGLELLNKNGQVEEHLKVEFHGGTHVYVPATRIELVQKYVGSRKTKPRLATIGGRNWVRQKKVVEEAVYDFAAELLQLQAERASRPGISFGPDTEWQREFDSSFPYTETTDQVHAIDAVKADMRSVRPMDRLICGDVGFGKTEIAMRAAFKAVDNGYQVAVLVPTTILVEQHYRTFCERMAEFPFHIAKLSRFCSPRQQRETVMQLAEGAVDIVIGTHRLASSDVQFHNLGLLIIDEEQRFGVEVKERLKSLRTAVDVLTLSATPIPRTLHMSLTGIRDISNLETPPQDRMAVETRVTRWSHDLIRSAVLRELNRGGQIFFVHNRVHDIERVAQKLSYIVPEARIKIGHGQMPEADVEQVMVEFVNHQFDMLLATTIVESGLDIPNANTIFIDDAHRYGLADMHQLRGRVGRYKHRAYCYLLVDPERPLTAKEARRLRAIEEFSEMGAGFSIAMRDLEIRGAGNLLGTQQSGHIATVGYELYCQLLETAVCKMRNLPPPSSLDVTIELPGEAYIPRSYVADMRLKIDLYRRLARTTTDSAIDELRSEMVDRFGPLPEPVCRLFTLARLKIDAAVWQIEAVGIEDRYLVYRYTDRSRAKQLVSASEGRLRIVDERSIYSTIPQGMVDPDQIIELARSTLRPLASQLCGTAPAHSPRRKASG